MYLKTKLYLSGLLIILFMFVSILLIYYYPNNNYIKIIKNIFPIEVKTLIRDKIFIIQEKNKDIEVLEKYSLQLLDQINNIDQIYNLKSFDISTKNDDYILKKYKLPFYNRDISNKTIAHIDQSEEYIFVITGNGQTFYFHKNDLNKNYLKLIKIKNNFTDNITDLRFYDKNRNFLNSDEISIKDIFIDDNEIYTSYVREISKDCFNTSILRANLNIQNLQFKTFFTYNECLSFKNVEEFNGQQSGGRIIKYKNNLLLTIGEYRKREFAQSKDSYFGKIIIINRENGESRIFTSGHRNPQGLFYDKKLDIIISTEHGPKGGDEINIIVDNQNYGWPISSYGDHYDGKYRDEAPLYKSHSQYGFVEPAYYFVPSIGISEIIRAHDVSDSKDNYYFVTSLKNKTIYLMKLDIKKKIFTEINKINIDERVRDIIYLKKENIFLTLLENTPSIGLIKYSDFD